MANWTIRYIQLDGTETVQIAADGTNLRAFLLENQLGPYTKFTKKINCGGRGICATCGVWIAENDMTPPKHWHDKVANRFGYPRLSCQVTIDKDLTVRQVDKWLWGNRGR